MQKPKIALYWCSSCGGCEESIIDLAEDILEIAEKIEIVFWPVALDFKYKDVEMLEDKEIIASFINGAIWTDEQEQIARLLRKKSRLVIAHGTCAHLGGVVGLANFYSRKDIFNRVYKQVPSVKNPQGILPGHSNFHERVKSLSQVIDVDYYVPGCPPPPMLLKDAILSILQKDLPPKGSVFGDKRALCYTCSRLETKPDDLKINEFKRLYEIEYDSKICFLNQGIICLGPATRGGCKERCIKANMPCRGCFGPTDNVKDQGAKLISAFASMIDTNNELELNKIVDSIPDPAGLFYRYSLASSILNGKFEYKT
ncbi:MAG: oxidoreductase [Nitrospirae bacterium]|nr:oxidoreductase [Nitrospirota bacterium]